jgi:hypothetical protein
MLSRAGDEEAGEEEAGEEERQERTAHHSAY